MQLYSSFASPLLDRDLRAKGLFKGVNCEFDIGIDALMPARLVPLRNAAGITRNHHLRLANRIVALNNLFGGVEYRIEVRERQEGFSMASCKPVLSQPLLNFWGQSQQTQHVSDCDPVFPDA